MAAPTSRAVVNDVNGEAQATDIPTAKPAAEDRARRMRRLRARRHGGRTRDTGSPLQAGRTSRRRGEAERRASEEGERGGREEAVDLTAARRWGRAAPTRADEPTLTDQQAGQMNAPGLGTSVIATYERFAELLRAAGRRYRRSLQPARATGGLHALPMCTATRRAIRWRGRRQVRVQAVLRERREASADAEGGRVAGSCTPRVGTSRRRRTLLRVPQVLLDAVGGVGARAQTKAPKLHAADLCGPEAAVHERAPAVIGSPVARRARRNGDDEGSEGGRRVGAEGGTRTDGHSVCVCRTSE